MTPWGWPRSLRGGVTKLNLDQERHWEHAYASTVHAAQGATVDQVLVHLDTKHEKTIGGGTIHLPTRRNRSEREALHRRSV
jgi:hypothetical protein